MSDLWSRIQGRSCRLGLRKLRLPWVLVRGGLKGGWGAADLLTILTVVHVDDQCTFDLMTYQINGDYSRYTSLVPSKPSDTQHAKRLSTRPTM